MTPTRARSVGHDDIQDVLRPLGDFSLELARWEEGLAEG